MRYIKRIIFVFVFYSYSVLAAEYAEEYNTDLRFSEVKEEVKDSQLIQDYPELKKFLYVPPKAPIYIGLGASPISLMGSKLYFSFNLFQVHYLSDYWDIEIFSASIGQAKSDKGFANSRHFTARTSPKFVFFHIFDTGRVSVGPLFGMEYVTFPSIEVKKCRNNICTRDYEELTNSGYIIGGELSQTFTLRKDRRFKVTEVFYKQKYIVDKSERGWNYQPEDPDVFGVSENKKELEASTVFMIEFSYLF